MHQSTEHIWGNTLAHVDSIAAGILIAVWLRGHASPLGLASRVALIAGALVCFTIRGHFVAIGPNEQLTLWVTLIGYPAVMLACAAVLVAFIGLPLRSPTLQYLGKISYGLYAYHFMSILLVDRFLPANPGVAHAVTRAVAAFGLTVAVAALSYVALEKPFLNLKRRFTFVSSRPV
jgi:peptidoglycan/LPS O-acetylase OafA/YrhL